MLHHSKPAGSGYGSGLISETSFGGSMGPCTVTSSAAARGAGFVADDRIRTYALTSRCPQPNTTPRLTPDSLSFGTGCVSQKAWELAAAAPPAPASSATSSPAVSSPAALAAAPPAATSASNLLFVAITISARSGCLSKRKNCETYCQRGNDFRRRMPVDEHVVHLDASFIHVSPHSAHE